MLKVFCLKKEKKNKKEKIFRQKTPALFPKYKVFSLSDFWFMF